MERTKVVILKGVWGKILRVDLTKKEIREEKLKEDVYKSFIGGGGLGARFLYHEVPAEVDAFHPENRLIFAVGPFQGLKQTGAGKWQVISRSPLIGVNAEAAATGWWGVHFKKTGYDALVIHGRAEKPVYLWITDGRAEIKDASHLWGLDMYETEDQIIKDLGEKDVQVAAIGQAGERLCRIACIGTEKKSFAGRAGLGAVMGSKYLKAVAVKGTKEVEYADPDTLEKLNKEINKKVHEKGARIREHGTPVVFKQFSDKGNLPIKNWQLGLWEGAFKLGAPRYTEYLKAKPWPCAYCTLQCHRKVYVPKYKMETVGPEYENLAMMGINCMVDDLDDVCYANDLANRYGLDAISLGAIIAWAMESYEKGVITKEDTGGLELKWGSGEALIEMTRRIGLREGRLGWLLGEGVKRAAETIGKGSEAWAVHIKGMEVPAHDPRAVFHAGLNYVTTPIRYSCHERGNPQHVWVAGVNLPEFGVSMPPLKEEDKWSWENAEKVVAAFQDYCNIVNSLVHCKFMVFAGYTLTDLLNTFNAATGLNWTMTEFRKAGERITNLQKLLNIRYGWKKEDDLQFPKRLMEPKKEGPAAGKVPKGIQDAVKKYYKHRGWDENGVPTKEKIKELGLEKVP
ncbi:MAG: aldehyde ferredoxin oxidoreductase family protein [Candidatus Bathyarchaeia archaeon]